MCGDGSVEKANPPDTGSEAGSGGEQRRPSENAWLQFRKRVLVLALAALDAELVK